MKILKATELTNETVTALIYAPPGTGKTTLLGMLPGRTLVVDVDNGTSVLKGLPHVDIVRLDNDLSGLRETFDLLQKKCDYANVCIDSLSELERGMLTVYGRDGKNDGAPEQGHYLRMQYKIMDYCRLYRSLPANVVFTAWEAQEEIIMRTGEKYTRSRPLINGKIVDAICGLCDIVGQVVISTKEETVGERYIRLSSDMNTVAKDRIKKRQYCKFEELI